MTALADAVPNVHFVGRLATYRYYNMDQVVGQSLATFARIEKTVSRGIAAAASRRALVPVSPASPIVATTATTAARNGRRASAGKG